MRVQQAAAACGCLALIVLSASGALLAQTAGRIDGAVLDPSGSVVAGATVSLLFHESIDTVLVAHTTSDGIFTIAAVRPDLYDLTVEAPGFATAKFLNIRVSAAAETSLPPIHLDVAPLPQKVKNVEDTAVVDTETIEVDHSITKDQIEELPALDRQVSTLFQTQTGVTFSRGFTVVNGMRTTATNVTYDGINIQDNFFRLNSLDFLPDKTTIDQVQEVTVNTSNPNPALGNGASQVILVSPSGTNFFHGSLYAFNRNVALAAADWFANQTGAGKAPLNLNQFGGRVGGPIVKDKLLFFFNYEGYREITSSPTNNAVLTASARQGILTYLTPSGTTRQLNVLQAAGLAADPRIAAILKNIPLPNNNDVGDGLNVAGYAVNEPFNENRKTFSGKLDYYLSPNSVFSGSFNYNTDDVLRPDELTGYYGGPVPVGNNNNGKLLSAGWRWTPTAFLTNELRGGFNFTALPFNLTGTQPAYYLSDPLISLPGIDPDSFPQGRDSKVFSIQDNAIYARGRHTVYFGYQAYILHEKLYGAPGVPDYDLGISAAAPFQFSPNNIPGSLSSYIGTADNLLATLAGIVGSYGQEFNVTSQTSGFVPGAPLTTNLIYNTYSGYVADNYKIHRTLTFNAGVRYDYWTPVKNPQGIFFEPVLENNNPIQTVLDPNAVLNFAGNSSHPFYKADTTNFSPNAGFAWDVFGDGNTSVRGGYSLSFFNDDALSSIVSTAGLNAGNAINVANNNAYALLANGLPAIQTPVFQAPLPVAANYALNTRNTGGIVDPNLRTPYYQQFNVGVEHLVSQVLLDVRYVGNHGTRLWQGFNENQINVNADGFLQDFINARDNGFLAQAAGLGFVPTYNPAIPGSKPLSVFAQLPAGGLLSSGLFNYEILSGQAGYLALLYQLTGLNGPINFFPNRYETFGRLLTNYANSTYNSLQTETRGKLGRDLNFQFSYVFSKVMTDAPGTPQGNVNDLLILNNGGIERGRASFDITHVFKANYIYHVPLGSGHRFMSGRKADLIFGGWSTSAIIVRQSGGPFSILDPIGTLVTPSLASYQTAVINGTTKRQLNAVVGNRTYVNGNGVYFLNPNILSSTGQGVAPFGAPSYNGEIFFNPGPGQIGNMQLEEFSGPWAFNMNVSAQKSFRIHEQQNLLFRADFYNVFNHASFASPGDGPNASVQSTTFGLITGDLYGSRVIQLGLQYRF